MVRPASTPPVVSRTDARRLATIAQLAARKQRYKLSMFVWLHRMLLMTVVVIAVFFVVSTMTFSGRLAEGRNKCIAHSRLPLTCAT